MTPQDPSAPNPPDDQPTIVAAGAGPPSGAGRPAWFVPALVLVAALAVAGVASAAVFKLTAGGARADEVVPASTLAFATLDLDPSAAQKVDAARFLRKFPQLRDKVDGDDLRRSMVEALLESDPSLSGIRYDRDIEPWLGDRLGIAVLPPAKSGDQPKVVGALQVRDEDAARDGLRKLDKASGGSPTGVAYLEGYVLLAESQRTADRAADSARGRSLAENPQYSGDVEQLGETGVSSGWVDVDGIGDAVRASNPQAATALGGQGLTGRLTYTVRFSGDDLELSAKAYGMTGSRPVSGPGDTGLARLPATTAFAVGVANGERAIPAYWDRLRDQLEGTPQGAPFGQLVAQAEAVGFTLPDDLASLFGSSFTIAFDGQGLTGAGPPRFGARSVTDPDEATRILDQVQALAGPAFAQVVTRERLPDGVVVATDPGYAQELATDGDLGSEPGFTEALPGLESADMAMWVGIRALQPVLASRVNDPETAEALAGVDAVGLTATVDGAGTATYTVRVVTR